MLRQAECLPQVNCVNRRQSKGKNETINEGRIDSFSWQSSAAAAIISAGKDIFTRTVKKKKNLISQSSSLFFFRLSLKMMFKIIRKEHRKQVRKSRMDEGKSLSASAAASKRRVRQPPIHIQVDLRPPKLKLVYFTISLICRRFFRLFDFKRFFPARILHIAKSEARNLSFISGECMRWSAK